MDGRGTPEGSCVTDNQRQKDGNDKGVEDPGKVSPVIEDVKEGKEHRVTDNCNKRGLICSSQPLVQKSPADKFLCT